MSALPAPRLADYEHLLLPSFQSSDGSIEEVRADVAAGRALFWPGKASVAITNESHEMNLWLVGGSWRELIEMEKSAEAFARSRGLNRMSAEYSRPQWAAALQRIGYRKVVQMVKDLK